LSEEENWEKLWEEFDNKDEDKLGLEKINICTKIFEQVQEPQKTKIQRELVLLQHFRILEMNYENFENPDIKRISEEIEFFVSNCDEKSYDYYSKRFSETHSFLNKWRYAFACWLLNKSKTDNFENAISSLTDYIEKKSRGKNYKENFHYIVIRYIVPKIYGVKKHDEKFTQTLIQQVLDIDNTENIRWSLEPIEVLCQITKPISKDIFNKLITIEHRTANQLRKEGHHFGEQRHLNLTIELCDAADIDSDIRDNLKKEIHSMLAESFVDAAEKCIEVNRAMASVMFYQKAVNEYQMAGMDIDSELFEKVRNATDKIEWVEARHTMQIPKIMIKGENGPELVNSISNLMPQIINQDQVVASTKELLKNNPISMAVTHFAFNAKSPTKVSITDEEILESKIMEENIRSISIGESWLANGVKELEEQGKISAQHIIDYLKGIGLHDEEQIKFIESGISEHFKGNHISSIHTLVPQIEGTLRSLLNVKGILTLKKYRQTIMDKELGGILSDSDVENFLGRDLVTFLKIKFTDYDGINFRNDVSHALRPLSDFNHAYSFSLIHVILILTNLTLK